MCSIVHPYWSPQLALTVLRFSGDTFQNETTPEISLASLGGSAAALVAEWLILLGSLKLLLQRHCDVMALSAV